MPLDDDVRVRLSAEGLAEVLAALRQIRSEAAKSTGSVAKTASVGTAGIDGFTKALGGARSLLASFGATVGIGAFVQVAAKAGESAERLINFRRALGGAIQDISALGVAARQSSSSLDAVEGVLAALESRVDELRAGERSAVGLFGRLGLSAGDFNNLPSPQKLELVSRSLANVRDDGERAAIASAILGKRVRELLPVLRDLGEVGLEGLRAEADALGLLVDDRVVANAQRLSDSMGLLGEQVSAAFLAFVGGVAPPLLEALDDYERSLGRAMAGTSEFGAMVGSLIRGLYALTKAALVAIVGPSAILGASVAGIWESATSAMRGHFRESGYRFSLMLRQIETIKNSAAKDFNDALKLLFTPPEPPADRRGSEESTGSIREIQNRRQQVLQAAADREIALVRATLKAREEADERAYDEGIIGIRDYYARRAETIREAANAEIRALERRRAAEAANPDRVERERRVADLDSQIQLQREVKAVETRAALEKLAADQRKAELDLARQVLEVDRKLAVSQDERRRIAEADIQAEADALALTLRKQGRGDADVAARRAQLVTQRTSELAFSEVRAEADAAFTELEQRRNAIRDQVRAGQLTELQGEARLLSLERNRLPALEALATALLAAARATGDPQSIATAQALLGNLSELRAEAQRTELTFTDLQNTMEQAAQSGLIDLLSEGRRETESWADAFLRLADSIVAAVRQLASVALVRAIFRGINPEGFANGGFVGARYAAGGYVFGPGSSTSDSIPAMLSNGEFVVRAAAVRRPNVREFLEALNAHNATADWRVDPALLSPGVGFAEGGAIDAEGARVSGSITVGLEPGLVLSELSSREGQRLVLNVIAKNPRAARRALGLG